MSKLETQKGIQGHDLLHTMEQWLSVSASLATILGVCVAIAGAWYAWKQHTQNQLGEREARAKALLAKCIELCIEHPKFAEPRNISKFKGPDLVAYKWFVGAQLNMCEELLKYSEKEHWRNEVRFIISLHEEWICSDEFQSIDINSYRDPLREELVRPCIGI